MASTAVSDTHFPQVMRSWRPDRASEQEVASDMTSALSEGINVAHRKPGDLDLHQTDAATFHFPIRTPLPPADLTLTVCAGDDIVLRKESEDFNQILAEARAPARDHAPYLV